MVTFGIVSAWVLIPLANQNQVIFSVRSGIEKPRQTASPDKLNMLHMFNNNNYTDFRTAYKHVLIPNYVIQVI